MQSRAAILVDVNKKWQLEKVEVDPPKNAEVVVRMLASGICHLDASVGHGSVPHAVPVILGHEGAGIVETVGSGVSKVKPGDRVVVAALPHCGRCKFCVQGKPFWCPSMMPLSFGGTLLDGTRRYRKGSQEISHFFCQSSLSEYAVVPEGLLVKVAADLPLEKLGPLGCGVQTGAGAVLNTAALRYGESAAVFGCGGVGLSAVMGARLAGAIPLIAVDVLDARIELAKELGATHGLNASKVNPVEEIKKITGNGVDYAFECVGKAETLRQAIDAIRTPGGTAVITGAAAVGTEIKLESMELLQKTIKGNIEGSSVPDVFIPTLADFWREGRFPFDRLISKVYALDEVNNAIADMEAGTVVKPLIRF